VPLWFAPFTKTLNRTVPLPLTVEDWPEAKVTEMCDAFVFPVTVTVVEPFELPTAKVTALVTLFPIVRGVGLAAKVHAPVGVGVGVGVAVGVGAGVGVGVGVGVRQFVPLFPQGVAVGTGVGVASGSGLGVGVAVGIGVGVAIGVAVAVGFGVGSVRVSLPGLPESVGGGIAAS
jgi:hypothetical protein